ncbi:MAG TPA: hypothetical protein VF615_19345 [Longimicrobiaceae bacterium]|jgi:uncharacterized lipoprotein YajG
MSLIRLPLAAFALIMLAACQSAAPTAPVAPQQPSASTGAVGDSIGLGAAERGGNLFGSGT